MRTSLYGISVDISNWNQLADYCQLHPGKSLEECLDEVLSIGLRMVDKASTHMPIELFLDLADCAYKLSRVELKYTSTMTPETAIAVQEMAANTFIRALEFHPAILPDEPAPDCFPSK